MASANTFDCFRECVGKKVVGVLNGAIPTSRRDLAAGTKTLVFDDGTGLTIASNGSYWTERKDEIERAIRIQKAKLEANERDIQDVLTVAGAME